MAPDPKGSLERSDVLGALWTQFHNPARFRLAAPFKVGAVSDNASPMFGSPIAGWHRWFAWHPVDTYDRGWKWLCFVQRRRIQKHSYLHGGADRWWQYAGVRP